MESNFVAFSRTFFQVTFTAYSLSILVVQGSAYELVSTPRNTVSLLGQRVEFECRRNASTSSGELPIDWEIVQVSSGLSLCVYCNGILAKKFSSRFSIVNNTEGQYKFIIHAVDMSDAGNYICSPNRIYKEGDQRITATAELIVLISDPICEANQSHSHVADLEYINIWMRCSVSYRGNAVPVFEWFKSNDTIDNGTINTTAKTGNVSTLITVSSSYITHLMSKETDVTFSCKTTFTLLANSGIRDAVNTHFDYQYTWNYTAVSSNPKHAEKSYVLWLVLGICAGLTALFLAFGLSYQCIKCRRSKESVDNIQEMKLENQLLAVVDKKSNARDAEDQSTPSPLPQAPTEFNPQSVEQNPGASVQDNINNEATRHYCALQDRTPMSGGRTPYCELRFTETPSSIYVNHPSTETSHVIIGHACTNIL